MEDFMMSIFKKKATVKVKAPCCCANKVTNESMKEAQEAKAGGLAVKILGGGCKKCNDLEKATVEALAQLGMETEVEHITDFAIIATYGVMTTPALVVDGKVLSYGKVLKTEEAMELIKKARA